MLKSSMSDIRNNPHSLLPNVEVSLGETDKRTNKIGINDILRKRS